MSTALAIAAVTETLRVILERWLAAADVDTALAGTHAGVTAVAPDQLVLAGANAAVGLNLYLHRVSLNQGWRNADLPSVSAAGERTATPPLALDLHYLLSAHGPVALQPETLLGHGLQALHHYPVLTRDLIGSLLPAALAAAGIAHQVESLRIVPDPLTAEDSSRLWSALQARHRPSVGYRVSVVLVEVSAPTRVTLPVLSRGGLTPGGDERGVLVAADLGPVLPGITAVAPASGSPGAVAGETVVVHGHRLDAGTPAISLAQERLGISHTEAALPGGTHARLSFVVPATLPVGAYALRVDLATAAGVRSTNTLPLLVLPDLTDPFPLAVGRAADGSATITLACRPPVLATQTASLILGTREVPAEPHPATTPSLTFVVPDAPVGDHLVRLRIDGVESPIIDHGLTPPAFLDRRVSIT